MHIQPVQIAWHDTEAQTDRPLRVWACVSRVLAIRPVRQGIDGLDWGYMVFHVPSGRTLTHTWCKADAVRAVAEFEPLVPQTAVFGQSFGKLANYPALAARYLALREELDLD